MKLFATSVLMMSSLCLFSQALPFDFETAPATEDFVDFDGGTGTVIANPQMDADNGSAMVAQIVRNGGEIWSGSKIILDANLDFSTEWLISMKVFCNSPVGTIVKFKLEGNGATEVDATTTVSGAWETLTWSFIGQPANFNEVVFMFDFGNTGDGSATSTFLFDDVMLGEGAPLLDLPVTYDVVDVDYTMTDFGGAAHTLVDDPEMAGNTVCQVVKGPGSATWAGTTIGTNAGFATYIPLTLVDSKMYARVWSPDAGIQVRLKVEDALDATHTCETNTITTIANGWENLVFDFVNEAPGTAELSFGLDNGWAYNMASIFFNFGTDGDTAGEKTYLFDDVSLTPPVPTVVEELEVNFSVYPNPTTDVINVLGATQPGSTYQIYDLQGRIVDSANLQANKSIAVDGLVSGVYVIIVLGESQTEVGRFVRK